MVSYRQRPTVLSEALRRSVAHSKQARNEEIRILVLKGGHGVRATAQRFYVSPALVCLITER